MVKHYQFKHKKLISTFSYTKYNQEVIYKINRPYEVEPWNVDW